jgi:diguanylate cyclase (GGDEF)-like protein
MLARLGLVQKFSLIMVILMLPLGVVGWGYMSSAAADRAFTAKELHGADVLIEAVDLFETAVSQRSGTASNADLTKAIERAAPLIRARSNSLGISGEWARVKAALDAAATSTADDLAVRTRAVTVLQQFLVTVGDRSNLTLDPELDTYYLMIVSQALYPDLVALSGGAELVERESLAEGADLGVRWSRVRDLARLMSDDLSTVASGLQTASRETADIEVSAALATRAAATAGLARPLDAALGSVFDTAGQTMSAPTIEAALLGLPSSAEVGDQWAAATRDLHHLLQVRVDQMAASRTRYLAVAVLCSVTAGYLLLSLFSGLLRSLREMRRVLHKAAAGDLEATIEPTGTDEIADVSRAINHAVAKVAEAQAELQYRARHDGLTGLLNRRSFVEALQERIDVNEQRSPVVLCFIDLDGFKSINDLHGHHTGDLVLKVVAERLRGTMPDAAVSARLAGDEFAVLLPPGVSAEDGRRLATGLNGVLREPIVIVGHQGTIVLDGASVGLAIHEGRSNIDAEDLLATADFAMYEAKSSATGQVREFTDELAEAVRRRLTLRGDLVSAFEREDHAGLWVAYQPIIDLRSDAIVGCEALARWDHPQFGAVSPGEFIPVAEAHGLIGALRHRVVSVAADQLAQWQHIDPEFYLSVNVSANELSGGMLELEVARAIDTAGVSSHDVWIELTESAMLVDPDGAARTISSLRRHGHPVAIDDFGTGYSSLSHLHSLELSALKVDRSFTSALDDPTDGTGRKILEMTVELARQLEMGIVAEGIESQAQVEALRALEVQWGQGFHLHRPAPADRITTLIAPHQRTAVRASSANASRS